MEGLRQITLRMHLSMHSESIKASIEVRLQVRSRNTSGVVPREIQQESLNQRRCRQIFTREMIHKEVWTKDRLHQLVGTSQRH